jgi:WD40 repeat protein
MAQVQPVTSFDGHASEVTGFAFHSDGKRVASASFRDVRIWDRTTGQQLVDVPRTRGYCVAFTPDGQRLAVGGYEAITIHDAANGQQVATINPHDPPPPQRFPFPPRVLAMAFSPDGRWLATAASIAKVGGRHGLPGGVVKIFEVESGKEVRDVGRFTSHAVAVAFSPDGRLLAAGSSGAASELPEAGELRVWNTTNFEPLFTHTGEVGEVPGDDRWSVTSVAFSPDGTRVASASIDRVVRVWDVPSGRERLTLKGHEDWAGNVRFSPNGNELVSAGADATVRVWNAASGEQLRSIPFDIAEVRTLNLSPDVRWLATGGGTFRGPGVMRVTKLVAE